MKNTLLLLLFSTSLFAQNKQINVTNLNFRMQSMTEHTLSYGFAKGDKVYINYSEERDKKLKSFVMYSESGSNLLSEFNLYALENRTVTINSTGIYTFKFVNSSLARRIINFSVSREPASEATANFSTEVKERIVTDTTYTTRTETYVKEEKFEVVEVASKQEFYVNSGTNALFKGGKSRVTMPVILPPNTVKWYYQVSSFRDADLKASVAQQMNLVSDLAKLVDQTKSVGFAIDLLNQPPGADYCDVYLLDQDHYSNFLNKNAFSHYPIGTRENIKSANVEVQSTFNKPMYLGIKNPDSMHGINVIITIAAVVHKKELATREVTNPIISRRTERYLEND